MGFSEFVTGLETEQRKITVLNRTGPDEIYDMLVDVFATGQDNVDVWETETPCGKPENTVLLENDERTVAVSTLEAIRDSLLLVNSDIYVTGTRSIDEIDTPDVVARMDDIRMFARDYPDPRKQKMLLVEISRYIEQRAWRTGEGELYSGFQRLGRIDDESGTREAYERLRATDLDVHVYGLLDWDPPDEMGLVAHGIEAAEIRDSWFVVFDPPRDEERKVALVAVKPEPGKKRWEAFWTHDDDRVDRILTYLQEQYH